MFLPPLELGIIHETALSGVFCGLLELITALSFLFVCFRQVIDRYQT